MEVVQDVGIQELIKALPLEERVPVLALKTYYNKRGDLDNQQEKQLQQVRKKYSEKMKPLLDRAAELIGGSTPKPEEVVALPQYLKTGEKAGQLKGKIIDSYWTSVLQNSQLDAFVSEKDERALESLLNIHRVNEDSDSNILSFKFVFKPNAYFEGTTAIRRLKLQEGRPVSLEGDILPPKVGNWLTHEARKVNNKSTGENKMMQGKKIDSFFDIFLNWTAVDNPKELIRCAEIFTELAEVVLDSFSFFLGLHDMQEMSEDPEDYEDEEVSEESEAKKKKK